MDNVKTICRVCLNHGHQDEYPKIKTYGTEVIESLGLFGDISGVSILVLRFLVIP